MKKAALYVRVSTAEQRDHGLSVDNQIAALKEYCTNNGTEIYQIYNDAGHSGHASYLKRPALLHLIRDAQAHRFDVILFTRLDRWFRSIKDYYLVAEQLRGIPWRAIWEDYTTETSDGQFKVNIMLSIAEAEASRTAEKVRSVMQYATAQGDVVGGSPPTGYLRQDKRLVISSEAREGVLAFWMTYLSSGSISRAREAAESAGTHIRKATAARMLRNPTYTGRTATGIECPAYITEEQFATAQKMLGHRTRNPKNPECVYLFSGLLVCGKCGGRMVAHYAKDGDRVRLGYGCCRHRNDKSSCPGQHISQRKAERAVLSALESLLDGAEVPQPPTVRPKDTTALEARRERLKVLYLDGDISTEEYRVRRDKLTLEISEAQMESPHPPTLPDNWKAIYDDLDQPHRQAFFRSVIDHITVTDGVCDIVYL